jgi:hypothetical protein
VAVEGMPDLAADPSALKVDLYGVVEGHNAWPDEAEIEVIGYAVNPRILLAQYNGWKCSVWKGPRNWRFPQKVLCRRDKTVGGPMYIPV